MARTKNTSRRRPPPSSPTLDIEPLSTILPDQNHPVTTTSQSEPLRITNEISQPINDPEINETEEIVIEAMFELSKSVPNSKSESFVTPQEEVIPKTQKTTPPLKSLKPQNQEDLLVWNLVVSHQGSKPLTKLSMKSWIVTLMKKPLPLLLDKPSIFLKLLSHSNLLKPPNLNLPNPKPPKELSLPTLKDLLLKTIEKRKRMLKKQKKKKKKKKKKSLKQKQRRRKKGRRKIKLKR
ncbi:hypothetical protein QL285_076036 [Trifolium repens]|nr:hypothetical protein QL285_076036 [Trifolium repens]